jgi:hypothetical protein
MERRQQHPAAADIILKLALARDLQQVYAGLSLNRLKVFVDELERVLEQRRFARALNSRQRRAALARPPPRSIRARTSSGKAAEPRAARQRCLTADAATIATAASPARPLSGGAS